ncbi:MAG: insulinase family protein [Anaerolineaceae bacterium]|nr:insulinase family protein [Anaerolineaceae bacterium]
MYDMTTLDNGLRVLTVTLPHVQSVSLGFFLAVGSRYESAEIAGISHFAEHMLFKGTQRWPTPRDIAEAIEGRGGIVNASTGLETTLYWAKVAASHTSEAMEVLSDMLLRATFEPAEMEKERAVIVEEINYALDTPDSLAQLLVANLQWPEHALGRDVAGSRETVNAISRQSLQEYVRSHYLPRTTILGLAGQVTHDEAVALAQRTLGDWRNGPPVLWDPAPLDHDGPSIQIEHRKTEQAHLAFSFPGISRRDPDRFVLRLLNTILGEGMRSRLFQEVRERLGLAYTVDSYTTTLQDTGALGIYAGVGVVRTAEAIQAILAELDRMRQEPVPEDELARAKEFIRGRMALSLEDSFAQAAWYARQELLGPDLLEPEDVVAQMEAVQAADIQRIAGFVFQQNRLNLAVVGPFARNGDKIRRAVQL